LSLYAHGVVLICSYLLQVSPLYISPTTPPQPRCGNSWPQPLALLDLRIASPQNGTLQKNDSRLVRLFVPARGQPTILSWAPMVPGEPSFAQDIDGIPNSACVKVIANNMTTSASTSTYALTFGTVGRTVTRRITISSGISTLLIHNAWHIYWDPTDVASLSPTPPLPLCSTSTIHTWAPDKSRYDGAYLGNKCENQGSDLGNLAVIIIVVIFGALFIGGFFFFIIRSYSKKKRLAIRAVSVANHAAAQAMQGPEGQT
ncbi:unnamed protein product, partial [Clonostachys rhizophaga]